LNLFYPIFISLLVFAATFVSVQFAWEAGAAEFWSAQTLALSRRFEKVGQQSARRLNLQILASALLASCLAYLALDSFLAAALGALLGASFPWLAVGILEKKKIQKFSTQLAADLDLCCGALRSGQSLNQALATLAAEAPQPSRGYFSEVASQVALGGAPEEALDALALSFSGAACADELRIFATSVSVTRATGGNLAEILENLASLLRERERLRAEIDSMTAQGRLSGLIVGALPVLILFSLQVMDPELLAPLFHTGFGLALLALSVLLECLGAFFIRRIVDIDV
jgi:tight adherence protein B